MKNFEDTIHPLALFQLVESGAAVDIIDVRTPAEFGEVHLKSAQNVPLDSLRAHEFLRQRDAKSDEPVYVICRTGKRASQGCRKLMEAGGKRIVHVEGGTDAWVHAGLPVQRGRKAISLERQVRIAAGLLVVTGVMLGLLSHEHFYALSAFVGVGLIFAGITDWCGMGMLMAKLPWNQRYELTGKD